MAIQMRELVTGGQWGAGEWESRGECENGKVRGGKKGIGVQVHV